MDNGGHGWYRNQQQASSNYYYHHQQPQQRSPDHSSAALDSVHDAQGLLAVYPPASATPTAHVARHLSNMTFTATPPTFMQQGYYHAPVYAREPNPPPYTEYAQELSYISRSQVPTNDGGYWEGTRNDAVRLLGDQSSSRYSHSTTYYPWSHHPVSSNYHPTPFAQSVIQRAAPGSAYPTPPPPSASSSLAFALGVPEPPRQVQSQVIQKPLSQPTPPSPPKHPQSYVPRTGSASAPLLSPQEQRQQPRLYKPEDSPAFFNDFLSQKTRQIRELTENDIIIQPVGVHTPPLQSSPDPIRLMSSANNSPLTATPRKRKALAEIDSPSIKRIQLLKSHTAEASRAITSKKVPGQTSPLKQSILPPTTPSNKSNKSEVTLVTPENQSPSTPTSSTRKKMVLAYISVPPLPSYLKTPTSSRKGSPVKNGKMWPLKADGTPEFGGYGSEDDSPTLHRVNYKSATKSTARRTGDRDERPPLEKLSSLIEDIFEAEDSLPADISDTADLPAEFFSHLGTDYSRPLLAPSVVRKLTHYIGHVTRPTKRDMSKTTAGNVPGSAALNTPRSRGRMTEIETQMLSRLLKMLERSVKAGEDLDPFATASFVAQPSGREGTASPRKKKASGKKAERRSKSQTPREDGEDASMAYEIEEDSQGRRERDHEMQETDHGHLTKTLEVARDSVLAADCCIALLASDRLPKQLYAEELITACLATIKNQLTKIIYPFVEATSAALTNVAPSLRHIVKNSSGHSQGYRRQISEIFQALSSVLPRVNNLINAGSITMSDTIIIQAVYIAIGPFFVVESGDGGGDGDVEKEKGKRRDKGEKENVVIRTFGKSAMRGLRLDALSLIRTIFANHEDQRSWIIEEILNSLIKLSDTKQKAGQFRLRDGRSIRTVSALLLQLVQTSAHDVCVEARRIEKARQHAVALRRQESFSESQSQGRRVQPEESFLDEHDQEELRLYASGLDSATKAAKAIVLFLTQRSGKSKTVKNTNEAEYRTIFDNLISDLLVVLYWPEWPAASLLLSIACKYMVSSLDDVKTSNSQQSESTNAAKTIALDHLGVVAAKIRSSMLNVRQNHSSTKPDSGREKGKSSALKSLDEIVSSVDIRGFDKLLCSHKELSTHLCKRSSEDQAYDSARELTAATFGQELANALRQVNGWITDPDHDEDLNLKDQSKLIELGSKLKVALREVWKDPGTDIFDIGSQEEVARIDRLAEEIGTNSILKSSFQPILNIILLALDAPAIFMRTKALRALGQIVTSDATILSTPNVRRAIESHLIDSSPAVRDAAVELIGKYMVDSPEVAGDYYAKIADRIADTGLSVRKRVIKLLKSFYFVMEDNQRRIDIATRLVLRMLDEDDSVKELATKTIEELWFASGNAIGAQGSAKSRTLVSNDASQDKSQLQGKVVVIMGTAANFKDKQSPLETILHKIMADKEGNEAVALHTRYTEICETLIDGLVDASDLPGFTVVNCIRTIYLFGAAYPPILSGPNASTLLPYLKNASTPEELATSDYLLKIFRVSMPHMPKTAAKFGHELQAALQPMILKPSTGGTHVLQEAVACMCIVVQNLTHDFVRLVNLMKSCNGRIQQAIRRPKSQGGESNDVRALLLVIFIASLLVEHCDFDRIRTENETLAPEIDSISRTSIVEHTYNSLIQLYEKYDNISLQARLLQCLGFLFRAQPTLMTHERSSSIMDLIFASSDQEGHGRVLRIIQDFLASEAEKHSANEKDNAKNKDKPTDVNMDELVGNTDGFADSGVSSAVVQRYLNPILNAALSKHAQVQASAIDVLTFTIRQGLAHPLQSFPVIIALETSPVPTISNRASSLHAILHAKHASLLNARYTISARTSFDYQKKICTDGVRGFRLQPSPVALLQRWYSLVREKRPTRQDFLRSLVKVFNESSLNQSSQDDVDFTRYMAENFAALEYKTVEEVLTVIKHLTAILSTAGMQVLEHISPSHLLAQLRSPTKSNSQNNADQINNPQTLDETKIPLMRTSVIIAMVMLLKAHLKTLYSLSEDKCNKFVVGKKSAIGDKPATKRHENPISWERLPYATTPILTSLDVDAQKNRFLDIWNEDGVTGEPEGDMEV